MTAPRLPRTDCHQIVVAVLVIAAAAPHAARAADPVPLKVERVAVFSSGVSYYRLGGAVEGDATAELRFRTAQINDLLKSLVVGDMDGGSVGIVRYASKDPVEKALKSFGINVAGNPSLGSIVLQLRGEVVDVQTVGAQPITGTVIGIEDRQVAIDKDGATIEKDYLVLATDRGLRRLDVSTLEGIHPKNEKIMRELNQALAVVAGGHDSDKKSVMLQFNGTGKRRVRAAYLMESPIWKTSYRLVIDKEGKPFLQGWATVENATEEDWDGVDLSLVSGRPISFQMDLYTPLYVDRPMEQLALYGSLRAQEFAAGEGGAQQLFGGGVNRAVARAPSVKLRQLGYVESDEEKAKNQSQPEFSQFFGTPRVSADDYAAGAPTASGNQVRLSGRGVESVASAADAGELFEYHIKTPVSISRQQSALLPIVNTGIEGRKLSIYSARAHPKHPLNALEMKNTTGLNLMQGPVTLFDGDLYAGDAKLPDLRPDEKRLVAYALDLATEVTTENPRGSEQVTALKITHGVLWHTHKLVQEVTYLVKNKSDRARPVLVEHPVPGNWTVLEPKEVYEKLPGAVRLLVDAKPKETTKATIRSESISNQTAALTALGNQEVEFWLSQRVITPAVKAALEKIVAMKGEIAAAERARSDGESRRAEVKSDQERVRQNIVTLDRSTDFYRKQLAKMETLESAMETLDGQLPGLRKTEQEKKDALNQYVAELDVE